MAQLNVAREPSMDEILASIRKIIESNEPGPTGTSMRQSFEDDGGDDADHSIDSETEANDFSSIEDRFSAVGSSQSVAETRTGSSLSSTAPLSLADVAARVRAASERQAVHTPQREQTGGADARSPEDSPVISRVAAFPSSAALASNAATGGSVSRFPAHGDPAPATGEPAVDAHAAAPEEPAEPESAPGSIVSPAVSRQVARAFDELAHAVENGPRRSFDEIAEAMLRPMLQEWLDDNLPTLVERLVREEIERVARGPRR
ncbi:DUF2497 domain-containing protein [Sinorhizobium medicae]|nr:DUF2497 domain-containing protein [Sinorhizobium medicae]